jgi:DNA repair photolyase
LTSREITVQLYGMKLREGSLCLFPDAAKSSRVITGRKGAQSPSAAAEASAPAASERVQFRPLACSTILNENANRALPFRWTINPYRGCAFGCSYCFARYTHAYLGHNDPGSFESRIYVKFQAAQVLAETLRPAALRGRPIAMGTATDPYQPAEERFGITRRILEVMARCPRVDLSITTKSTLVARDIDILREINRSGRVTVQITLLTLNPKITRIVERRTPPPRLRLETIRALHTAGIEVGIFVMPLLPGINDSADEMRALLRAARDAGVNYAVADPLRLPGPSRASFESVLLRHFPHLLGLYGRAAMRGGSMEETTRPCMERFHAIREALGLRADSAARRVPGATSSDGIGWLFGSTA